MKRRLAPCLVALAAALVPAMAAALPTFEVTARDGRLIPDRLEIPANQRVKLVFRNEGPGPEEFEIANTRIEKVLSPGATTFAVLPPRKSGDRFILFGEFHMDTAECIISVK